MRFVYLLTLFTFANLAALAYSAARPLCSNTGTECKPCAPFCVCLTGKCWGGKCVFDNMASMQKCFPRQPYGEPCIEHWQCISNRCEGSKCKAAQGVVGILDIPPTFTIEKKKKFL